MPDLPERIQLRRTKGWRKPTGAVVVARPSQWGNPFRYHTYRALARVPAVDGSAWEYEGRISADGARHDYYHPGGKITVHHVRYMTLDECVSLYRTALVTPTPSIHLWVGHGLPWLGVKQARQALAGKDLACWCPLDQPCHADGLLEIANQEVP